MLVACCQCYLMNFVDFQKGHTEKSNGCVALINIIIPTGDQSIDLVSST